MKKSHLWIMILCCLIPIVGLAAIFLFNIPISNVVFFGLILLCPISHLVMMEYMGHDHSAADHSQHEHHSTSATIPSSKQQQGNNDTSPSPTWMRGMNKGGLMHRNLNASAGN